MKILVVEDDTLIREGLSEFLSESGYSIIQEGWERGIGKV